jgi:hypothetical protein
MEDKKHDANVKTETSLVEIISILKVYLNYLLTKWIIILIFGLSGGAIGLIVSLVNKPVYTAHLSFSLMEKSSSGGLADLASTFGISGLGGGNNSAFSGDNLLEIFKSRYAIEKTLLTPVIYNGKKQNLVEVYIEFSEYRKLWAKNKKNNKLQYLSYPLGLSREKFTRLQDSVLYSFYEGFIKSNSLLVLRKDKKISIVNMDFTSRNEQFSKMFLETLMDQTYKFYKESKTLQSRANVNMMQHTADSIKALYESAIYKGASISSININQALQFAAVPRIKQEHNAQLYGTVYAEVLKNLETLKLDMARETPMVQIIDMPRYPLKMTRLGKVKGIFIGGILGGILIIAWLLGIRFFKQNMGRVD